MGRQSDTFSFTNAKPYISSGGGIGYVGAVCQESEGFDQNKFSINCYGTSVSDMGSLLAHEIGHNLGNDISI